MADNIIDNATRTINAEDVLLEASTQALSGAIGGGILGIIGKYAGSFFVPELVSGAGGFSAFAGVGALAALLKWLPELLTNQYIDKNVFLKEHPHLQSIIKNSSGLAYSFASVAASAALVGSPVGPTLACMMLLPMICWALNVIRDVMNPLIEEKHFSSEATSVPSSC
ncbi:hypothetical protein [Legionella rowbothamii]|uniref:hypothetical protein n=1 Tax=Legionella rowbothamii TaxID=96229 RepID=UPI001054C11D|nr:hypothetical protein [Legionella rowbothamii]